MSPTSSEVGIAVCEVITTADRLTARDVRGLENGIIMSAVVGVIAGVPLQGELWVECGIMRGGVGEGYKRMVLMQDYVTVGQNANWQGGAPVDPNDQIYLEARGAAAYLVRFTASVYLERVE